MELPPSAYLTLIRTETNGVIGVAAIAPDALADPELKNALASGEIDDFVTRIQLDPDRGKSDAYRRVFDPDPFALLRTPGQGRIALQQLVHAVLVSDSAEAAVTAWGKREAPAWDFLRSLDDVLAAALLREFSKAKRDSFEQAALTVAGAVGAAAATAEGAVLVVAVAGVHGVGLVLVIASPVGIVLAGAGAATLTYRLLKWGHR